METILSLEDSQRLINAEYAVKQAQRELIQQQTTLDLAVCRQRIALLELGQKYGFDPNLKEVNILPEGLVSVKVPDKIDVTEEVK